MYIYMEYFQFKLVTQKNVDSIRGIIFAKKTTYALKKHRVVALPFIYGVEYIIISKQKRENYYSVSIEVFMCFMIKYNAMKTG